MTYCKKRKPKIKMPAADRHGFTVTELIVAATLLVTGISVATSLTVRSGRLWQDARHYRLAIDELSNHLECLVALDADSRPAALAGLSPSPQILRALPHPVLTAEFLADAYGKRLVLHLRWNRPGQDDPVTLVGWIDPAPPSTTPAAEEDTTP